MIFKSISSRCPIATKLSYSNFESSLTNLNWSKSGLCWKNYAPCNFPEVSSTVLSVRNIIDRCLVYRGHPFSRVAFEKFRAQKRTTFRIYHHLGLHPSLSKSLYILSSPFDLGRLIFAFYLAECPLNKSLTSLLVCLIRCCSTTISNSH